MPFPLRWKKEMIYFWGAFVPDVQLCRLHFGSACSVSAQDHLGRLCLPACAQGSPGGAPAPSSCPARHPPLPAPLQGGRSQSPYPWLLGAGSMLPRLDRRVVLLPHHPQAIDAIPVVPGVLRDTRQSTPNGRSSSRLPQTHNTGGKTIMWVLPQGAASSACAATQDQCPWSAGLDAPL